MLRLEEFGPLPAGAVWRGTATRLNDIHLHLFADDAKTVEIVLMDQRVAYEASQTSGLHGQTVDVLSLHALVRGLQEDVGVHLRINAPHAARQPAGRRPRAKNCVARWPCCGNCFGRTKISTRR